MDCFRNGSCYFFILILLTQWASLTGLATTDCPDISTLDDYSQEHYIDSNDTSARYITYDILAESYEKKCFQMKIQKDNTKVKFSWKKNGGTDTDLNFFKTHDSKKERKVSCIGTGSAPCIGNDWTTKPYTCQADAGDVLEWEFWYRTNRLSEGGKASIAIFSGEENEVEPPQNHLPSKPELNCSSARINANDTLWLSATSYDTDNDTLCYSIDWSDGPLENISFVPSNTPISLNHSWRAQGSYEVRVGVMDKEGVIIWSDPCNVVIDLSSGILFKRVPQIAYANENCVLEIDPGTTNDGMQYCVDWGDGNITHERNSIISHIWSVPGMYEIKAGVMHADNGPVIWSDRTEIALYRKEIIHSQNCNLNEMINGSNDFVEFCLVDPEYCVSGEININNKKHFRITSKIKSILRGLNRINIMILIRDSTNITISNLTIVNLESGLKLINCNDTSIQQNEIDFDGSGYGIRICSGHKITIKHNVIKKVGPNSNSNYPPVGIKIESGKDIDINSNSIYEDNPPHPNPNPIVAYSVKNAPDSLMQNRRLSNINISISRSEPCIGVKYSNCDGRWDCEHDIVEYNGCTIPDQNLLDTCIWWINE